MNENRFYVYVHTCKETGEVRYIGKGTDGRYKHKSNRTKEHREIWDRLDKKILIDNLEECNALKIENELTKAAIANNLNLLNKVVYETKANAISYSEMSKYFYCCNTSPTGLRAKIRSGVRLAGDVAGYEFAGYWRVKLKGKALLCHRVVYCLHNRVDLDPKLVIDHIDGNPSNNLPDNLQQISRSVNNQKASKSSKNTSGEKGVSWSSSDKKWVSFWSVNRKFTYKSFIPSKLYPNVDFELAKQLAFNDAVEHRKKMVELYYSQSLQTGEIP